MGTGDLCTLCETTRPVDPEIEYAKAVQAAEEDVAKALAEALAEIAAFCGDLAKSVCQLALVGSVEHAGHSLADVASVKQWAINSAWDRGAELEARAARVGEEGVHAVWEAMQSKIQAEAVAKILRQDAAGRATLNVPDVDKMLGYVLAQLKSQGHDVLTSRLAIVLSFSRAQAQAQAQVGDAFRSPPSPPSPPWEPSADFAGFETSEERFHDSF